MGSIRRFNLDRIIREYKTRCFFETGTFRGDGVDYALQSKFQQITSVEIIPEIANTAKERFAPNSKVSIIENNSEDALAAALPAIRTNCLFWLDAHFPGADAGLNSYDDKLNDNIRLPLIKELETISRLRKNFHDVLILDDLRIYEDGPFVNGNVPADALPFANRNIDFVYDYFQQTHVILKCYLDEGYILIFPKFNYWKWYIVNKLFTNSWNEKDFYLV